MPKISDFGGVYLRSERNIAYLLKKISFVNARYLLVAEKFHLHIYLVNMRHVILCPDK